MMGRLLLPLMVLSAAVSPAVAEEPVTGKAAVIRTAQASPDGTSRPIRQIAPEIVAPPRIGEDQLRRIEPRAPLSELGPARPAKPKRNGKGDPNMIFGPVATAAGRIEAKGMVIAIAGVEIIEPEQTCRGRGGEWPCGMVARTAFRSFLRGRALNCDMPEDELSGRLSVSCRLGGQDLGAWLVANGWAKVASTGPYAQEQNQALADRLGIFGPGPETLTGAADASEPVEEIGRAPLLASPADHEQEPGSVAGEAVAPPPTAVEPFLGEPKGLY